MRGKRLGLAIIIAICFSFIIGGVAQAKTTSFKGYTLTLKTSSETKKVGKHKCVKLTKVKYGVSKNKKTSCTINQVKIVYGSGGRAWYKKSGKWIMKKGFTSEYKELRIGQTRAERGASGTIDLSKSKYYYQIDNSVGTTVGAYLQIDYTEKGKKKKNVIMIRDDIVYQPL